MKENSITLSIENNEKANPNSPGSKKIGGVYE